MVPKTGANAIINQRKQVVAENRGSGKQGVASTLLTNVVIGAALDIGQIALFLSDLARFFTRNERQSKGQSPDLSCIVTRQV